MKSCRLFGQRIVVTRAREQAGALSELLHGLGAEVIELPTIEIQPAADYAAARSRHREPARLRLADLHQREWRAVFSRKARREPVRICGPLQGRICAIGPATRDALERFHLKVDVMAEEYVAEGLLEALAGVRSGGRARADCPRRRRARSAAQRTDAPRRAGGRGGSVSNCGPAGSRRSVRAEVLARKPDWITFTSSSTVQNLVDAVGAEALRGVRSASIGPITSATLRAHGVPVAVEAPASQCPAWCRPFGTPCEL